MNAKIISRPGDSSNPGNREEESVLRTEKRQVKDVNRCEQRRARA